MGEDKQGGNKEKWKEVRPSGESLAPGIFCS